MKKPLKFHQTLNLAPRSAKHGQHRRSSSSSHRDPIVGTDYSAGGSDEDDASNTVTISWSTLRTFAWEPLLPEPKPPAIPNAGIRTGELIGHRLWWLIEGQLCSLAHRQLWKPGESLYGDTNKLVSDWWLYDQPIWGGTYAYASADYAAQAVQSHYDGLARVLASRTRPPILVGWSPYHEATAIVAGTIKMWGDVVEHEHGYRAEFAKLNSIDSMYGLGDIDALCARYGVTPHSTDD